MSRNVIPRSSVPDEDGPSPNMLHVLANIASFMGRVRGILESARPDIKFAPEPFFEPYLEMLRSLAEEKRWDTSGLDALSSFAEIWDTKARRFRNGEMKQFSFSAAEVRVMSESVAKGDAWIRSHFG